MFTIITKLSMKMMVLRVSMQLAAAAAGKEGTVPATTPGGVKVVDASSHLIQGPDARAFGSKVPSQLSGFESTVVTNRMLASCSLLLRPVLLHEEGHVMLDAVPELGWTMLDAELACDQYMLKACTYKEVMSFTAMLMVFNPSMLSSGQFEAYNVNNKRIEVLMKHLGL